jgi:hypothetical protein
MTQRITGLPAGLRDEGFFLVEAFFLVDVWRMGLGIAIVMAATIKTMADKLLLIHCPVSVSDRSIPVFRFGAHPVPGDPA